MDSSEPVLNFLGRREFMAKSETGTSTFGLRTFGWDLEAKFRASLESYRPISGLFRKKLRPFFFIGLAH